MKRKPKDYSEFIWNLPEKTRLEILTPGRRHLAELAEKIAYFAPPFDYLKTVRVGFDPWIRYMLDRCLAGEELALRLRDAYVATHKNWFSGTPTTPEYKELWQEFSAAHQESVLRFIAGHYPWRAPAQGYDERRFQRHPKIDDYFNAAVLDNLGSFGFRRLSRSFKSEVLSRPLVIKWDKGTWSMSMSVFLEVPSLAQQNNIAMPFCFSGISFDFALTDRVELQLQTFVRSM